MNKMMKLFPVLLLLAFVSCEGTFVDPGRPSTFGGGFGGDFGGFGGDFGGGGGNKPAKLSSGASYSEAMAKLDEIIAYSGSSTSIREQARILKESYGGLSSFWSGSVQSAAIISINALIDQI